MTAEEFLLLSGTLGDTNPLGRCQSLQSCLTWSHTEIDQNVIGENSSCAFISCVSTLGPICRPLFAEGVWN